MLWLSPRLATAARGGHWLRRSVTAEALLSVLVLLAVAVMASLEPARQTATRFGDPITNATDVSVALTYLDADVSPLTGRAAAVAWW